MRRFDRGDPACVELPVDRRHQAVEAGLVLRFGAGDEHVLGVRRAQQPPAVLSADPHAVSRVDLRTVAREPVTRSLRRPGARFTIRLDDGTEVRATSGRKRLEQIPEQVRFRYSGDPSREVFLFEYEEDPFWVLVFFWGAAAVTGATAWAFGRKPAAE